MNKILLNIHTGETKEISADYDFWHSPTFTNGVEFVWCNKDGRKDKLALINKDFELITDFIFDNCNEFSEGLVAVEIAEKWGYINSNGDIVVEPQFKQACDFENGMARVQDIDSENYNRERGYKSVTAENPLADNISTFFMNRQGDILQLTIEEQREYLRKANKPKEGRLEAQKKRWEFKEFIR